MSYLTEIVEEESNQETNEPMEPEASTGGVAATESEFKNPLDAEYGKPCHLINVYMQEY